MRDLRIRNRFSKSKFRIKKKFKNSLDTKRNGSIEIVNSKNITNDHKIRTKVEIENETSLDAEEASEKACVIDSATSDKYDKAYEKSIEKIEAIKREMLQNIEKLIERDANLNNLQEKSCNLNMNILDLQITTKSVRRQTLKKKHFGIFFLILLTILMLILLSFYLKYNGQYG